MATQLPIIFVLGCPASGKGTLCKRLACEYPVAHLSVGDLLRKIKDENTYPEVAAISTALAKQELIDPKYLFPILKDELEKLRTEPGGKKFRAVLLDGFPRSEKQMREFETEIAKPVLVLSFNCPKETAKERYLSRKLKGREADDEAMFEKRFAEYEKEKIDFNQEILVGVNTGQETEVSWEELQKALTGAKAWTHFMS